MRTISTIALHDLRVLLTDRTAVVWFVVMPIAFAALLGFAMGGSGAPSDARARLTVVDYDGGAVAEMLLQHLESERLSLVPIAPEDKDATPDKIRTLIIPEGLTANALSGVQTTLILEQDPGSSPEAALVAKARIVAAIAAVLGRLVEARSAAAIDGSPVATAIGALPPTEQLVTVDSRFAGTATTVPSGFAQSIPGNIVMFVMLVAMTYGAATVSGERSGGLLQRLATSPASRSEIIAGKIIGRWIVAAVQLTVLMGVGVSTSKLIALPLGDHALSTWVVLLVYAAAVAPLGVAFGAWFTDPDRAASVGVIVTMAMAAFGGCWWPLEVVSKPLQTASLAFPTGWAMRALHGTISYGRALDGLLLPIAALAAFAAVFTAIAFRSLRFE